MVPPAALRPPPELLNDGEGAGTDLSRTLDLNSAVEQGVPHISARTTSCDTASDSGSAAGPRLAPGAADRLPGRPLILAGTDESS
jgi:hypothetical protein